MILLAAWAFGCESGASSPSGSAAGQGDPADGGGALELDVGTSGSAEDVRRGVEEAGVGEGEGEGEGEEEEQTCPRPSAAGEPSWCAELVPRINSSQERDLDEDGELDFFGVREYRLDFDTLLQQDPGAVETLEREGFPQSCSMALLVPHGGGVELGTEQLARAVLLRLAPTVRDTVGLWVLAGRNSKRNLCSPCLPGGCPQHCHHVRSTAIDPDCETDSERRLARTLNLCATGISLHGQDARDSQGRPILVVGGANPAMRAAFMDLLNGEVAAGQFDRAFRVVDGSVIPDADPNAGLRGIHRCNVVNRFGAQRNVSGLQLELPVSVRPVDDRLSARRGEARYFYRHESQNVLGDAARFADILARFICEQSSAAGGCGGG